MNTPFYVLVLLAGLCLIVPAAVDLSGTWAGNFDIAHSGPDVLTLVLTKIESSYSGILNDSLGFVAKDTPITEVKYEGGNLNFSFALIFETGELTELNAKLILEGDRLTGRLESKAKGAGFPFELVRRK